MASKPAVLKILDLLGVSAPKFMARHPVLTATGVGIGYGGHKMHGNTMRRQQELMREYGGNYSKYSSAGFNDLNSFEDKKRYLSSRVPYEKTAAKAPMFAEKGTLKGLLAGSAIGALGAGLGTLALGEGFGGIKNMMTRGMQKQHEKKKVEPVRQQVFSQIVEQDPIVSHFNEINPTQAQLTYNTMVQVAPTLSTEPQVVTSFMRNAAMTDGVIDFPTIKGLAEAERAVLKAQEEYSWLPNGAPKKKN
jgi:predicted lipid-binding transport protein (Tim44 family)